ncbi:MAG: T9SS type A sorting domain-containing protein, partial [Bacteroidota bacterium]
DLRLLIDRNGNGFADNDVSPVSGTLTGSEFSVAGVNFQNGDYFTVGSVNVASTPLPIELSSFDIVCVNDKLMAKWTTLSEKNCAGYVVEKSFNAVDFYEVGKLAGAGNSSVKRNYTLALDSLKEINNELAYFRLKQIDIDGLSKTFPLKVISCEHFADLPIIYPNPSTGAFFIDHDERLSAAEVFDMFGRKLLTVSLEKHESEFCLSGFPKGFYYLRMLFNNQVMIKKIILH